VRSNSLEKGWKAEIPDQRNIPITPRDDIAQHLEQRSQDLFDLDQWEIAKDQRKRREKRTDLAWRDGARIETDQRLEHVAEKRWQDADRESLVSGLCGTKVAQNAER